MATYKSFEEWLDNAIIELQDTHDFHRPLIEALKDKIRNQNFKRGVEPLSRRWESIKQKYGQPNKRLEGFGELLNSVKTIRDEYALCEIGYPADVKHSQRIKRLRGNKNPKPVDMQTLAYWHLNGEGNLPKNQDFVWLTDEEIAELERIFISKFD